MTSAHRLSPAFLLPLNTLGPESSGVPSIHSDLDSQRSSFASLQGSEHGQAHRSSPRQTGRGTRGDIAGSEFADRHGLRDHGAGHQKTIVPFLQHLSEDFLQKVRQALKEEHTPVTQIARPFEDQHAEEKLDHPGEHQKATIEQLVALSSTVLEMGQHLARLEQDCAKQSQIAEMNSDVKQHLSRLFDDHATRMQDLLSSQAKIQQEVRLQDIGLVSTEDEVVNDIWKSDEDEILGAAQGTNIADNSPHKSTASTTNGHSPGDHDDHGLKRENSLTQKSRSCDQIESHSLIDQEEIHALHLAHMGTAAQSDLHSGWHVKTLLKRVTARSHWDVCLEWLGFLNMIPRDAPDTPITRFVHSVAFSTVCIIMTILNALVMGWEADATMRGMLANPVEDTPQMYKYIDLGFTIFFCLELFLRILAGRIWFFMSPTDWGWHWLDVFLVVTSVLSDLDMIVNLNFFRLLRVFRIVRVAKVIKNLNSLRSLRKMMLSIQASIASLAWAFVFLALLIFVFSIFFLNGASEHIKSNKYDDGIRNQYKEWYSSLPQTMFALLVAISGGTDWIEIMSPVQNISWPYQVTFTFYVLFVVVGVLNVLTGIFLESAAEFHDRDLTVQAEIDRLDSFVQEMLDLFSEFHPDHDGMVSWEIFQDYLRQEHVEAYLSSHMLEPTHARLLFRMLDHDGSDAINIYEFVIGMLRLRGAAKTYDSRVLLHEIHHLRMSVHQIQNRLEAPSQQTSRKAI